MGNLRMDKSQNKAFTKGKEILLSQKEFEVLWLLASHPTQTFSSEDILESIMASGIMIHEKQFVELMTKNICKKAGLPFIRKNQEGKFGFKNKYLR